LVTADFAAYYAMQRHIDEVWRKPREWARLALLNIAGMAYFSSDRSIREYADDIWRVPVSSG
ncbi:MAG: glycogen/starch/alpha-glucan phosphorylase, partial [Variibacter sp.]